MSEDLLVNVTPEHLCSEAKVLLVLLCFRVLLCRLKAMADLKGSDKKMTVKWILQRGLTEGRQRRLKRLCAGGTPRSGPRGGPKGSKGLPHLGCGQVAPAQPSQLQARPAPDLIPPPLHHGKQL